MRRLSYISRFSVVGLLAVSALAVACSQPAAQSAEGGAGGRGGRGGRGRGGFGGGAQPVVVAKASQKDVPVDIEAVGNVEASTTIAVRTQITGTLETMGFKEGDFVKKGSLLFTIDRRPLEAALQQAEANLVRDQALVNQAEAQLARDASSAEYQTVNAQRQTQLVEKGLVDRNTGDQARSQADATALAVKADRAAVESARAQLSVQEAAVNAAKVQLSYTTVRSPIDGRTSDIAVKPGNLVTANTSQLMTIAQLEPVFVTFSIPATHLPTIKRAATGTHLRVVATPQDEDNQPEEGELTFWDNVVDPATDTIKLKATMLNWDRKLWPGQFVRVKLRLQTLHDATVVPQQALQTGQDGQFVFVVQDNMTVEQRPVMVAQRVADDVVIQSGLQPGETVVTDGQLRLEQGTRVQLADANGLAPAGGRGGRGGRGGGRRGGGAGPGGDQNGAAPAGGTAPATPRAGAPQGGA
jgi:multidrug efflux system membrane fusion protein